MIDEFIGQTLSDKYQIEELLRESELGKVYRGHHLLMEKPVTVMILAPALAVDESIVESFSIEARTISRLSHPNILNVTDFGRDEDGTVFIVMEDGEGKNLKEVIREEGAFSVERAVRIARQIASGLSAAHASAIIHGHLTSENILLSKMVNDSELAKIFELGSFDSHKRENFDEQDSLDRLAYLSPEQCSASSEVDQRSDIYALGIIFYEMLVGEVPFSADNATDLMLKHAEVPPPPFAAFRDDIPGELEPITIKALAKNPDMRYQTAAAFAEDLGEVLLLDGEMDSIIIQQAIAEDAGNTSNIWKTAFVLLAGISLLAFGMIYWTNTKQTNPSTVQQVDENGLPVQPLNPATGLNEQNLPNIADYPTNSLDPNDPMIQPDIGGDGYDPWRTPGTPPGGVPSYQPLGPGENTVVIPGDSGSIFTQDEPVGYDEKGNPIYLIRRPVANPTPATKTDGEKTKPENDGKTPAKTDDKIPPNPDTKPTVKPETRTDKPAKDQTPAKRPEAKPSPAANNKNLKSGDERDT